MEDALKHLFGRRDYGGTVAAGQVRTTPQICWSREKINEKREKMGPAHVKPGFINIWGHKVFHGAGAMQKYQQRWVCVRTFSFSAAVAMYEGKSQFHPVS